MIALAGTHKQTHNDHCPIGKAATQYQGALPASCDATSGCWGCCLHFEICYYPCQHLHYSHPLEKLLLTESSRKLKYPA